MPLPPDETPDPKNQLDGLIKYDETCKLYVLIINDAVVSKSKHRDYWEYHQKRGDLAKAIVALGITRFVHEGMACVRYNCIAKTVEDCLACKDKPAFVEHHFATPAPSDFLAILGFCSSREIIPIVDIKRKRGRPKKDLIMLMVEVSHGVKQNKLSDDEPGYKSFNKQDTHKIKREYNHMITVGDSMKEALNELAKKYHLPYKRVYDLVLG